MTEAQIEKLALNIFQNTLDYEVAHAANLSHERQYSDVILRGRLVKAIAQINPTIPTDAQEDAVKQVFRIATGNVLSDNEAFHTLLTEVLSAAMENPTIVVLTDRNDLDQQLFETFSNCRTLSCDFKT